MVTRWWEDERYKEHLAARHTDQGTWDARFIKIAKDIGTWSKCASRSIGAVLVTDNTIIGTGYNGAPRGVDMCQDGDLPCVRRELGLSSGQGLELCPAVHAEENAVLTALKNGQETRGSTLYCWCCVPCVRCAGVIIQCSVARVVCWPEVYNALSLFMFKQAGVVLESYDRHDFG